jgi:hypothetical protein
MEQQVLETYAGKQREENNHWSDLKGLLSSSNLWRS